MPSPFPGMDPYLEGSLWMSVHSPLAVEIIRQLNPKLRPRYIALTVRRFILDVPEDAEDPQGDHCPHRGGSDHEDRREQRAGGSCVFCQMRRIHRKPTNI